MKYLTIQEIFDKSVSGVLKQNCLATDSIGGCHYRGPNGTKCGIGHLIDDEHYDHGIEDLAVDSGVFDLRDEFDDEPREKIRLMIMVLNKSGVSLSTDNTIDFLESLQMAHDGSNGLDDPMENYRKRVATIAEENDLSMDAIQTL